MSRTANCAVLVVFLLTLSGCSMNRRAPEMPANNQPSANNQSAQTANPVEATVTAREASTLRVGEASGSYTCNGETVELKYAYAGRGERFGHESIILLLTDKPIPAEAVAQELKSTRMLYDQKVRGLEYVFDPDNKFYWVSFHPDQYQKTSTKMLKEFSVKQDIVTGRDETSGDGSEGRYKCSVTFVAAMVK